MDIQKTGFLSIDQAANSLLQSGRATTNQLGNRPISFEQVFREKLKFSKHAAGRLEDRNISLTDDQIERLNDGAKIASEKGIKESLVIVDKLAFIVNVPNNTVITAMDSTQTDENVFTNINGAVIM